MDSSSITIEYILIIIYSLFYFFEEINEPNATFIYSSYSFWLITGILIYSTGTFFLFMQSNNLTNEEWKKWSIINNIFTMIKNGFFCIAVSMKKNHISTSKIHLDELYENPFKPM